MKIYQVDAFANKAFEGNPAAVVPLTQWLPESVMQQIAQENNLAETAFFVPCETQGQYQLRWFTPTHEVALCGHATLASAHVLFSELAETIDTLCFETQSGPLYVTRENQAYCMNFPSQPPTECTLNDALKQGLGITSADACLSHQDYIVILPNEQAVLSIEPDHNALLQADLRGVIVSAVSSQYDFVARFFGPKVGVPEDSVTGSAYTQLTPYWAKRLAKSQLSARQVASRGGDLLLRLDNDRVKITGGAHTYMVGDINI
ncbi:PhzF family phenazine biosynthesis protein [Glaciecola sp. XM2]|jgi:PhzF family phenazine biosynthesis protein|uniref:PhzF family phenazine biosynthesis protein n=1 Tax=Glaciecola sp. XM2 TaxID=1914931 RepID=UPI001BDEB9C9|nr:PhzF family phenazine biosynthesis protein [Glaciecola sp. XM2]MBT1451561.1 PhzF family phenazine biosynthesis protein [Glaciecola sp. XM2]